jgi:hypothetical protein
MSLQAGSTEYDYMQAYFKIKIGPPLSNLEVINTRKSSYYHPYTFVEWWSASIDYVGANGS